MNEQQWLTSDDPHAMLTSQNHGHGIEISDRKLRLFACAACRLHWDNGLSLQARQAVEVLEGVIEGKLPEGRAVTHWVQLRDGDSAHLAEDVIQRMHSYTSQMSTLLREIVGNPFRPIAFIGTYLNDADTQDRVIATAKARGQRNGMAQLVPDCVRTTDVIDMAQQAYDSRDFTGLPYIADALEEAGCTCGDVLAHLRGPEPHARGCWVLDLILGKE